MAGEVIPTIPGGSGAPLGDLAGLFNNIGNIGNLVFGTPNQNINKTETVGPSTETVQNIVDPAAINKVVQDMLEGNGTTNGLAALMQGAMGHGMYGASTSALLGNDLVSRIVGEVAKLTSGRITTKSGQTNTTSQSSNTDANKAAQAAAIAALLKALSGAAKGGSKEGGSNKGGGLSKPKPGNKDDDKPTDSENTRNTVDGERRTDRTNNEDPGFLSSDAIGEAASINVGNSIDTGVDPDSLFSDSLADAYDGSEDDSLDNGIITVGDPIIVDDSDEGDGLPDGEVDIGDITEVDDTTPPDEAGGGQHDQGM